MRNLGKWIGIGIAVGIAAALIPIVQGQVPLEDPLSHLAPAAFGELGPDFSGLDMLRLKLRPQKVFAPLKDGKVAELTLDPELQRTAVAEMERFQIPEAGAVMLDVKTGKVLVYASYVASGEPFDVNARAEAPSASVFKVVTGSALVEKAKLNAETEQCYHGGKSRLQASELEDDERRDKWCATLGIAMGRSLNVVFGRLARKHLTPEDLTEMAGSYGYGAPVPFEVANEAPSVDIPPDPLEFARSAAGFWHSTLSPLAAATLAQTVANDGVTLKPWIVRAILEGETETWAHDGKPVVLRRAIEQSSAQEVNRMMQETVANGSAYKSFHDRRGKAYLPDIAVAGKTGTLNRESANRFYTWFVGFAPADRPEVAIAVLVVNTPQWRIKGPELARDVLRAYFAKQGRRGVTAP